MGTSDNVSRTRPLIVGAVVGLIVGLAIGLAWAWLVQPAYYQGGAYPNELSDAYQKTYVKTVAEAYLTTRDVAIAADRLSQFNVDKKVELLATVAKEFNGSGRSTEAALVGDLAAALMQQEGWSADDVSKGLTAADATQAFATKLGQVPSPAVGEVQPQSSPVPTPTGEPGGGEQPPSGISWGRILLIVFFIFIALVLIVVMLTRIKPRRRPHRVSIPQEMQMEATSGLQPLRQWSGSYSLGQDNYDESFTIESADGKFLGECGIGILDGFASGSPKRVLAFDVWLFDKTDIRTISVPVMSRYAFEDNVLRSKLPRDAEPIVAVAGSTFDIETSALVVKAKIEEVAYGDEPPAESYFTSLKVTLSAYLKSDVDVSGDMPIPEGYA